MKRNGNSQKVVRECLTYLLMGSALCFSGLFAISNTIISTASSAGIEKPEYATVEEAVTKNAEMEDVLVLSEYMDEDYVNENKDGQADQILLAYCKIDPAFIDTLDYYFR